MRAIVCKGHGGPEVLTLGEVPAPACGEEDVRIRVRGTAVNRADLVQCQGHYPPPADASPLLGLECAGEIIQVGPNATPWKVGDQVMALLPGGGYAEEAVAHKGSIMPLPKVFTDVEGGAFPEAFLTAFSNLFMLGEATTGTRVLIHGGSSGVRTSALALCREASITAFVTAGSDTKCDQCVTLGAKAALNYKTTDWSSRVRDLTDGLGVDVILDCVGAKYLEANIQALRTEGKLLIIGLMGGRSAPLPLDQLLMRRLTVRGSTLRSRSLAAKAGIVEAFSQQFGSALAKGRLRPVIDSTYHIEDIALAHEKMQGSTHVGKLALRGFVKRD